jgi:hypothetical protein
MQRPRYRILYNLPRRGWIDRPRNNRRTVTQAVEEAMEFVKKYPGTAAKVINERTKYLIWQSSK